MFYTLPSISVFFGLKQPILEEKHGRNSWTLILPHSTQRPPPSLPRVFISYLKKPYFSQDVFSALENNPTLTNKTLGKRVLNADKPNTVGQTADRP